MVIVEPVARPPFNAETPRATWAAVQVGGLWQQAWTLEPLPAMTADELAAAKTDKLARLYSRMREAIDAGVVVSGAKIDTSEFGRGMLTAAKANSGRLWPVARE